ncbi:MAG: PaaI family thioesterase [Dehalococcoidia bacterium]|nr:PaaI family thioesterase [Dehalococcoidia bacterium]
MSELTDKEIQNLKELKVRAEHEPIGSFLGMKLVEIQPGYARVTMKLKPEYQTFNGFTFGGMIMSAADQAFACAVNSFGRSSVASQFNIHFVAGARPGDEIAAECRVIRTGKRVDIAEITVVDQEGKLIARATGTAIPLS